MKNCTDCIHANWRKTEKGRLHPSGYGRCTYKVTLVIPEPLLPFSKIHLGSGVIYRKIELDNDCPCYVKRD